MENFQAIYGREYRDYTSSDRKSANLTINKLSQAALNTQMHPNKINCSRIDTFSTCTSTTYRQGHLLRELLHARVLATFILRGYSFHDDHLYSLQQTLVVNSHDCQRASTSRQLQSSTSRFYDLQRHYCYDEHYYCYEHYCYDEHCCMFLLVKIVHAYEHYCLVVEL